MATPFEKIITAVAVIVLFTTLVGGIARADGGYFPPFDYQQDIFEPEQKALILHDGYTEHLVIEPSFKGSMDSFVWVVPVPSKPELHEIDGNIFRELAALTAPERARSPDLVPFGRVYSEVSMQFAGKASVDVVEQRQVGIYYISVVASDDAAALKEWLTKEGYALPQNADLVIKEYVDKRWFFVAMKIVDSKQGYAQYREGRVQPLYVTFTSPRIIYPLRISSINKGATDILLYVFSKSRVEAEGYTTEYAKWIEPKDIMGSRSSYSGSPYGDDAYGDDDMMRGKTSYDMPGKTSDVMRGKTSYDVPGKTSHDEVMMAKPMQYHNPSDYATLNDIIDDKYFLTKLRRTMWPKEMTSDLILEQSEDDDSYLLTVYPGDYVQSWAIAVASCVAVFMAMLVLLLPLALITNALVRPWSSLRVSIPRLLVYAALPAVLLLLFLIGTTFGETGRMVLLVLALPGFVLMLPGVLITMLFAVVFEALHLPAVVGVLLGAVIGAVIGTIVLHVIIAGILKLWWKAHEKR